MNVTDKINVVKMGQKYNFADNRLTPKKNYS